ncbi:hypothetical protein LINPERPRIM_LOCUS36043 [Linum perenne]
MNPSGAVFPHTLRSKLIAMGTFKFIPRTSAFRAVQRQTAASRSIKLPKNEQHGVVAGVPTTK